MKKTFRLQSSFTLHASYKYQVHSYMHRVHSCTRRMGENFMHASRAVPSSTAHVLSSHVPVGNNEQELEISFHNVETRTFAFTERRCSRNVEHGNKRGPCFCSQAAKVRSTVEPRLHVLQEHGSKTRINKKQAYTTPIVVCIYLCAIII